MMRRALPSVCARAIALRAPPRRWCAATAAAATSLGPAAAVADSGGGASEAEQLQLAKLWQQVQRVQGGYATVVLRIAELERESAELSRSDAFSETAATRDWPKAHLGASYVALPDEGGAAAGVGGIGVFFGEGDARNVSLLVRQRALLAPGPGSRQRLLIIAATEVVRRLPAKARVVLRVHKDTAALFADVPGRRGRGWKDGEGGLVADADLWRQYDAVTSAAVAERGVAVVVMPAANSRAGQLAKDVTLPYGVEQRAAPRGQVDGGGDDGGDVAGAEALAPAATATAARSFNLPGCKNLSWKQPADEDAS